MNTAIDQRPVSGRYARIGIMHKRNGEKRGTGLPEPGRKGVGRLLLLLFVLCCQTVQAGSILDDFKKLNQHYLELRSYGMDFIIRYYGETGLVSSQQGEVIHTEKVHYVKLADRITLISGNEFVAVDGSTHTLVYNRSGEPPGKAAKEQVAAAEILSALDSLWADRVDISCRYLPSEKGKKIVMVEEKDNAFFTGYSLTIDESRYRLLELVYYLKQGSGNGMTEIHISYMNETARPKTNLPACRISTYVSSGISGATKPSEAYRGYHFIDQTR